MSDGFTLDCYYILRNIPWREECLVSADVISEIDEVCAHPRKRSALNEPLFVKFTGQDRSSEAIDLSEEVKRLADHVRAWEELAAKRGVVEGDRIGYERGFADAVKEHIRENQASSEQHRKDIAIAKSEGVTEGIKAEGKRVANAFDAGKIEGDKAGLRRAYTEAQLTIRQHADACEKSIEEARQRHVSEGYDKGFDAGVVFATPRGVGIAQWRPLSSHAPPHATRVLISSAGSVNCGTFYYRTAMGDLVVKVDGFTFSPCASTKWMPLPEVAP
jgi:hypothetical protein